MATSTAITFDVVKNTHGVNISTQHAHDLGAMPTTIAVTVNSGMDGEIPMWGVHADADLVLVVFQATPPIGVLGNVTVTVSN